MKIYDRIYELCKINKLTGKELGEQLKLKKSPMTDWKNGKSQPTVDQIIKICEIFGISSDYLLFGKIEQKLNIDEKNILNAYRIANPTVKEITRKLLDIPEQKTKSLISKIG